MVTRPQSEPYSGSILVSEPHLNDYYFSKSVVLLADHSEEGSFGIIVNKPISKNLNEVVEGFPPFNAPVYLGGPVSTDSLFYIHTLGDEIEGSSLIMEGIYWGGNIEQVRTLMEASRINPDQIRFFIGYSGWTPNQLNEELERHSWVVCNASVDEIIVKDTSSLWMRFLRCLGDEYAIWSNYPADPALN